MSRRTTLLAGGLCALAALVVIAGLVLLGRGHGNGRRPGQSAAVAQTLSSGSSTHRALRAIWGPATLPDGSAAMPLYKRLGVQVVEVQVPWNTVAPKRPVNATDRSLGPKHTMSTPSSARISSS